MHISDKPSEALRQAVDDLEKCEQDSRFEINMGNWMVTMDGVCQICLAGAILAQQCGIPDEGVNLPTTDLPDEIVGKMWGIDEFRVGRLWDGIALFMNGHHLWIEDIPPQHVEGIPQYVHVEKYSYDPVIFKGQMRQIADMLEKVGL